jgi:glutamyl/glutaminyl-tRNA synthetase
LKDPGYVLEAVKLEQERVVTLADFGPACAFFFFDEPPMDEKAASKWLTQPHVPALFTAVIQELLSYGSNAVTASDCETFVRSLAEKNGFEKLGPIVHPIRVALTGKTAGPGLFELMSVLGPDRMIERLTKEKPPT